MKNNNNKTTSFVDKVRAKAQPTQQITTQAVPPSADPEKVYAADIVDRFTDATLGNIRQSIADIKAESAASQGFATVQSVSLKNKIVRTISDMYNAGENADLARNTKVAQESKDLVKEFVKLLEKNSNNNNFRENAKEDRAFVTALNKAARAIHSAMQNKGQGASR